MPCILGFALSGQCGPMECVTLDAARSRNAAKCRATIDLRSDGVDVGGSVLHQGKVMLPRQWPCVGRLQPSSVRRAYPDPARGEFSRVTKYRHQTSSTGSHRSRDRTWRQGLGTYLKADDSAGERVDGTYTQRPILGHARHCVYAGERLQWTLPRSWRSLAQFSVSVTEHTCTRQLVRNSGDEPH